MVPHMLRSLSPANFELKLLDLVLGPRQGPGWGFLYNLKGCAPKYLTNLGKVWEMRQVLSKTGKDPTSRSHEVQKNYCYQTKHEACCPLLHNPASGAALKCLQLSFPTSRVQVISGATGSFGIEV